MKSINFSAILLLVCLGACGGNQATAQNQILTAAPTFVATAQTVPSPASTTTSAAAQTDVLPPREPFVHDGYVMRNVVYCANAGDKGKLDVYYALEMETAKAPAVVFFHGSGGSKGGAQPLVPFLKQGLIVVDADYREDEQDLGVAVQDAKCVIRFLHANASRLQIDAARIGAYGCSYGSYLTAMLALTDQRAELEGSGSYLDQSSRVQAAVPVSGFYDLALFDLTDSERAVLPQSFLNPINSARRDVPPMLLVHGDNDTWVDYKHAESLYNKLKAAGAPVELWTIHGGGHCLTAGETKPTLRETVARITDFFVQQLKP